MRTRTASVPDLAFGALLVAAGGFLLVNAPGLGLLGEGGRLAPGTMPAVWGAGLVVSGLLVAAVEGFRARARSPAATVREVPDDGAQTPDGTQMPATTRWHWSWRPVAIYLLLVVAVVASRWIGFLAAFGVAMAVLLLAVERRPVLPSLATVLGSVAAAYLLFDRFLQVPIP